MFDRNIHQNVYCDINNLPSSNIDVLNGIDPDINNLIPNCIQNQCKCYDTSSELRKDICFQNSIAILHTNICSSSKKIKKITYYIDNLNITFTFIGLSETWASEIITIYFKSRGIPMNNAFVRIRRKEAGQVYTYTIVFNIEEGAI